MDGNPVSPETSTSRIRAWLELYRNFLLGAIPRSSLLHLRQALEIHVFHETPSVYSQILLLSGFVYTQRGLPHRVVDWGLAFQLK